MNLNNFYMLIVLLISF